MRRLLGILVIALVAAFPVAAGSNAVWVNQSNLTYGDHFSVGFTTNTSKPWALARCYANASTVLDPSGSPTSDGSIWGAWFSLYQGGPSPQNFVLGVSVSPYWTAGGANCTVGLYRISGKYLGAQGFSSETLLAQTSFTVAP